MDGVVSHSRSTGIDALFQYTGSGVQIFSGSIFYIIIAHLFSTTGVGAIALFVAIINLFNVIFQFGLGTASQHFISYNLGIGDYASARHTIYKILGYGFSLAIAGLAFLLLTASLIAVIFLHSASFTFLVRLLGIVLFGNIMFGVLNGTLLGTQNFRISALINIVIWVSYYFGSVLLAVYLRSLNTIILGWAVGIFIGVALELFVVLASVRKFNGQSAGISGSYIFSYSIPILLSGLISYGASSADRFVVSGILNPSSLGVYNFSLLIASSIGFISVPFNNILMPKFSEFYARGLRSTISSMVKVSSTLLSSIYVPAALGVAALAPIILNLLGGANYVGGAVALQIIMFFTALFVTQNILSQAIASVRLTRTFVYSSAISLISNIALSLILIPPFGLPGAALGFSSVYVSVFAILWHFAKKNGLASLDMRGLAKIWIASGIMYLVVILAEMSFGKLVFELPIYIVLGGLVYLFSARALKVFQNEDKTLVLSLFPENYRRVKRILSLLLLH